MNKKIPCGGFYLSDTLGVDENGKLGVNGGEPYKSLVTDGTGTAKWEDKKFTVTFTSDDGANLSSDKTFSEIIDAYKAKKTISAVVHTGENDDTLLYVSAINETVVSFFSFRLYRKLEYMQILFYNNGEIRYNQVSISAEVN